MPKPEEITESIKQLGVLAKTVSDYVAQENFSVKYIKDDVNFLNEKKESLMNQLKEIQKHIDDQKNEGNGIVEKAKEEAKGIVAAAREQLAAAFQDRELAKAELETSQRTAYINKKKQEAKEVVSK